MRSRNGNNYFSLSICLLIFFDSLALNASEYLISYRYTVKDTILYNENLQISKAMQKCNASPTDSISLKNYNNNLKDTISHNPQKFIDFIYKNGIEVRHRDETINGIYSGTTILTLKTTCFKVDFNEKFARITTLK